MPYTPPPITTHKQTRASAPWLAWDDPDYRLSAPWAMLFFEALQRLTEVENPLLLSQWWQWLQVALCRITQSEDCYWVPLSAKLPRLNNPEEALTEREIQISAFFKDQALSKQEGQSESKIDWKPISKFIHPPCELTTASNILPEESYWILSLPIQGTIHPQKPEDSLWGYLILGRSESQDNNDPWQSQLNLCISSLFQQMAQQFTQQLPPLESRTATAHETTNSSNSLPTDKSHDVLVKAIETANQSFDPDYILNRVAEILRKTFQISTVHFAQLDTHDNDLSIQRVISIPNRHGAGTETHSFHNRPLMDAFEFLSNHIATHLDTNILHYPILDLSCSEPYKLKATEELRDPIKSQDQTQAQWITLNEGWQVKTSLCLPIVFRGMPLGFMLLIHQDEPYAYTETDISVLKTLTQQLGSTVYLRALYQQEQTAKQQIKQMADRKNQYMASLTHELRSPLNHLITCSMMMEQGMLGELNPKQKEYTSLICNSAQQLLAMINDLLDMAKIESGKFQVIPRTFDLLELIRETTLWLMPQFQQKEQTFTLECDPNLPNFFYGDAQRIRQVLSNLLSNAYKFTPNGKSVCLKVYPQPKKGTSQGSNIWGTIVIAIHDEGPGLPPEDLARIFEPFEQANATAQSHHCGTGLGLSISKTIVELHQGEITV